LGPLQAISYRFHPEAEVELNLSIDYYESLEPGLGYDFAIEVYDTNGTKISASA